MSIHGSRRRWLVRAAAVAGAGLLVGLVGPIAVPSGAAYAQEAPGDGKLLMVLDASLSMEEPIDGGQTKIDAARKALHATVGSLPQNANVGMRVFGATKNSSNDPKSAACSDSQLVVPVGAGNTAKLDQAIDAYQPFGDTPIAHALKQAAADLGPEGQRSILLVSDGEETCVPDPCETAKRIADQGIDLQINTVGFRVDDKARQQLRCIAEVGNGTYYDTEDAESLTQSLERLSERAFRPFQFTGTPLRLAESSADVETVGAGQYLTEIAHGGVDRYVAIEKSPGSSAWATATTRAPADTSTTPRITMEWSTPDGTSCGEDSGSASSYSGAQQVFTNDLLIDPLHSSYQANRDECVAADRLLLRLRNGFDMDASSNYERDYTLSTELVIAEEGAVAATDGLPRAADEPEESDLRLDELSGDQPRKVNGGLAFSDAPLLEAGGVYRDEIVPGESLVYRVRGDFGQQIQYGVRFHTLPSGSQFSPSSERIYLSAFNPARANLFESAFSFRGDKEVSQWGATYEIRYLNRAARESQHASVAGDYYVVVQANHHEQTVPMTFDLGVAVAGEPSGQPGYAPVAASGDGSPFAEDGAPRTTNEGPAGNKDAIEATGSDRSVDAEAEAESGGLSSVALPAGLGAAVVLAVAFAILLLRRPKRAPRQPLQAAPNQYPPHQYPPHQYPPHQHPPNQQ